MENSINRVKGTADLFYKYICDAEKELNEEKISTASEQVSSHIRSVLKEYLKELLKLYKNEFEDVVSVMDIKNEMKKQNCIITHLAQVLNAIENNLDFAVNTVFELFKSQRSSDVFKNKYPKFKMKKDSTSNKMLVKTKKRNNYPMKCNRTKVNCVSRKKINNNNRNDVSLNILQEYRDYKRIMDLGTIGNNAWGSWNNYRKRFYSAKNISIPHDTDNSTPYTNILNFVTNLANLRHLGMNCIIFYNNDNTTTGDNEKVLPILTAPIDNANISTTQSILDNQTVPLLHEEINLDKPSEELNLKREEPLSNFTFSNYAVYAGSMKNDDAFTAKINGPLPNEKKAFIKAKRQKFGRKTKQLLSQIKQKNKKKKDGLDFCFICKKIKTCLCGTEPDVVSESQSVYVDESVTKKALEMMKDPDAINDESENDFLKRTYVYTAISNPSYNIPIRQEIKQNKPVVCSIDITGPDTGNIVIQDGNKLHNLGFKINDWYLKPAIN